MISAWTRVRGAWVVAAGLDCLETASRTNRLTYRVPSESIEEGGECVTHPYPAIPLQQGPLTQDSMARLYEEESEDVRLLSLLSSSGAADAAADPGLGNGLGPWRPWRPWPAPPPPRFPLVESVRHAQRDLRAMPVGDSVSSGETGEDGEATEAATVNGIPMGCGCPGAADGRGRGARQPDRGPGGRHDAQPGARRQHEGAPGAALQVPLPQRVASGRGWRGWRSRTSGAGRGVITDPPPLTLTQRTQFLVAAASPLFVTLGAIPCCVGDRLGKVAEAAAEGGQAETGTGTGEADGPEVELRKAEENSGGAPNENTHHRDEVCPIVCFGGGGGGFHDNARAKARTLMQLRGDAPPPWFPGRYMPCDLSWQFLLEYGH